MTRAALMALAPAVISAVIMIIISAWFMVAPLPESGFTTRRDLIEDTTECPRVKIPDHIMEDWTDGGLYVVGQWLLAVVEATPSKCIYITNEDPPTLENPVDLRWAKILASP